MDDIASYSRITCYGLKKYYRYVETFIFNWNLHRKVKTEIMSQYKDKMVFFSGFSWLRVFERLMIWFQNILYLLGTITLFLIKEMF